MRTGGRGGRPLLAVRLGVAFVAAAMMVVTLQTTAAVGTDVKVTDHPYIRHDAGTDSGIIACSNDAPGPEAGGNRQQNEPTVAINPKKPWVITAGANDYCGIPVWADAWMGFYVSQDSGASWKNSLNPGYPTDTSAEGMASPIFQRAGNSGDPIMDWDNHDMLFYGGISFNRNTTNANGRVLLRANGDAIVSTWRYAPSQPLGMDYLRTVIVGEGTPSANLLGVFNDKPSLRVDDWEGSNFEGNVYISWTLFPGAGQDQVMFSRSTDHGATFSNPIKISKGVANAQGSDIAVAPEGTIYVVWRQFAFGSTVPDAIVFVKSIDGGQNFSDPRIVKAIAGYDRSDIYVSGGRARDCGSLIFRCVSNFTFHRTDTQPNAVVDARGTVHVTWEELIPEAPNGDTYHPDGQSQVEVVRSSDGGASWSDRSFVDHQSRGHQWWPNLEYDKSTETIYDIYYDSRSDPSYSPYRPPGNLANGTSVCAGQEVCDVLDTYIASSKDGTTWKPTKVSTIGHQPEYEMFGNRRVPFHGDYVWVDANGGNVFGVWTDNRDVVPGVDPRETSPDGFDVLQCRTFNSATGTWSSDKCPNAGGLNQNVYGARLVP